MTFNDYVVIALAVIVTYEAGKDYLRTQGINDVYDFCDSIDFSCLKHKGESKNA